MAARPQSTVLGDRSSACRACRFPSTMGGVIDVKRPRYLVVAWGAVSSLIVAYLIVIGLSAAARLPLPVEFMYGESIVLDLARRVASGESLYPAPDHLPLAV